MVEASTPNVDSAAAGRDLSARVDLTPDELAAEQRALVALAGLEASANPAHQQHLQDLVRESKRNGASRSHEKRELLFELVPVADLLTAQAPPQWDVELLLESGVNAGLVAPPESGKSLFALNVVACVATGQDFHGRKVRRGLAVYLCGEGFGGIRKRLQALELRYNLGLADAPLVISRTSAPLLEPTEVLRVRAAIDAAEQRYGMPLSIIVQDTLSRFIAPGKESDAPDMSAYFQAVDYLRRGATSITLHHPGHGDATRARGSSSWRAALDCEYTLAMAGDMLTVTCAKMKDGDRPAQFSFRLETAPTSTAREDGSPVMSVVLVPADGVVSAPSKPTGKNQKQLLAELERRVPAIWTERELREIARGLGMHRNSAMAAVLGLRQLGYLTDTIGGARLTHDMHESTNHAQDR